ncbi:NnrU family protein [Microvirga rosea]|uniref:NnrU family protein n=1 Tax=Microvirga rosea TaxID=2715425 RepID=UPI001D0B99F7|nr:NnrU family protein [Microvirga rosea]MCB8821473.1 NnrU family protein [Microvirga rosea]
MIEFYLALAAFLGAHLIPASRGLRAHLIALMGRTVYMTAYSVLSLVLLGWLITAAQRAETVWLWDPAPWQWHVPLVTMPVATFFLVAGLMTANPLSISIRNGCKPGPVTAITRHPVLWAFLIWAMAHIPPNGTGVALLLFGAMILFSLLGFVLLDLKAYKRLGPKRWRELSAGTSILPFAALLSGRVRWRSLCPLALPALIALALYVWFVLQGHALLIGPDPLAGLKALR